MDETKFTDRMIAESRLIAAKISPLPWTNPWIETEKTDGIYDANGGEVVSSVWYDGPNFAITEDNAAYLLDAVNNWPDALTEIAALRATIASLRQQLDAALGQVAAVERERDALAKLVHELLRVTRSDPDRFTHIGEDTEKIGRKVKDAIVAILGDVR